MSVAAQMRDVPHGRMVTSRHPSLHGLRRAYVTEVGRLTHWGTLDRLPVKVEAAATPSGRRQHLGGSTRSRELPRELEVRFARGRSCAGHGATTNWRSQGAPTVEEERPAEMRHECEPHRDVMLDPAPVELAPSLISVRKRTME